MSKPKTPETETWVEFHFEDGMIWPSSGRAVLHWINGRRVRRFWKRVR